jgi:hypothetical protein
MTSINQEITYSNCISEIREDNTAIFRVLSFEFEDNYDENSPVPFLVEGDVVQVRFMDERDADGFEKNRVKFRIEVFRNTKISIEEGKYETIRESYFIHDSDNEDGEVY